MVADFMRSASALLAIVLACSPLTAHALAPSSEPTAEQLYEAGRALYETADYDGAIDKWTAAYSMLGDDPAVAETKTMLLYNIAGAHEKGYAIDEDLTHLSKARILLERFDAHIDSMYEGEAATSEHARAQARIAAIEQRIAEARDADPGPQTAPAPQPEPEPEPEPTGVHKPMVIAGGVLAGLGVGLVGLGVGAGLASSTANDFSDEALLGTDDALDLRALEIQRGLTMNTLTYVGFIAGGVLLTTGAVLIGVGVSKKRRARPGQAAVAPMFGPGSFGLAVTGSF